MYINQRALFMILLMAEVGSSFFRLLTFPSDVYPGSLNYIAGRLFFWLVLVISVRMLRSPIKTGYHSLAGQPMPQNPKENQPQQSVALGLAVIIAIAIEALTTIFHWASPYSNALRDLYESVWYWHRVPRQSDYGWPSFRGYFWDHLIPWAIIFGIGLLVWFIRSRHREKHAADNPA